MGKETVPWEIFIEKFAQLLKLPTPNLNKLDLNFLCFKKILTENDEMFITGEKFGLIANAFGPIVVNHKGFSILDKV